MIIILKIKIIITIIIITIIIIVTKIRDKNAVKTGNL